ncbi:MAG: heparinase II/III family protein [Myxococcota bacterium]|nr:heparinase II/III family protein [Myxococcota bacterium]
MSRLPSLGRALRTVRHLRLPQATAQLRHVLGSGAGRPLAFAGPPPALAVRAPSVPFLPPPPHVACELGPGDEIRIRLLAREVGFCDGVDWQAEDEDPLFAYHLHHLDFARDEALSPAGRVGLLLDWIANHERGVGWESHPLSHRIFAWGKMLSTPGVLVPGEEESATLRHSFARQVETLSRYPEVRLQANHLFTNLAAVVFGGLLLEADEAQRWLGRAAAFRAELRDQIYPDGAHEERSPMYHCLLLEQVLDLLNLVRAVPERAPVGLADELEDAAGRMCGALEVWTHPDGEIALFADSAFGIASPPGRLVDYATALGIPVQGPVHADRLDRGGYARLADDCWHLIASVAGPGPDHQPGHAHCDALSFELSVFGRRIVTDTGVFEYLPGLDREVARRTRSHSTLEISGQEQAEIWSSHRVGGRPRVRLIDFQPSTAFEATCHAWSTPDVGHHRRFELADGGLHIHDRIEGPASGVRFALPLAPGLDARLSGEADSVRQLRVTLATGELQVDLPGGSTVDWRLEASDYFPSFGRREHRWCLVGSSDDFEAGVWRFRVL